MDKYKFIINVEGCIVCDKKILMVLRNANESHAPNTLSFPGGKIEMTDDDNSTLENGLKREILEEIGLKISDKLEYLESKKFITNNGNSVLDIVFYCQLKKMLDLKLNKEEISKYVWMNISEIIKDNRSPKWIKKSVKLAKLKLDL